MTFVRFPSLPLASALCLFALTSSACSTDPGEDEDESTGEEHSEGDSATSTADTGEDDELNGECALVDRVGLFSVVHEPDYSAVDGEISNGVIPTAVLEETVAEGGCRLLKRENPFCDPPCSAGEVCTQEGTCIAYPERQDTGTITVEGLDVDVVMEPRADKRYFETELPQPAFSPGGIIRLTSTGGEVGPLSLSGRGFAPIELDGDMWTIAEGQSTTVNWVPEPGGEAKFYLSINIDQHGNSPSTLVCEVEDTGSLVVPAAIIDALLESGTSGFPMGHAYRRTVDSVDAGAGCIEFQVRSHVSVELSVAGHTPCNGDGECPDGLTCDIMNQTCV